jgi:hypothetical protein
MMTSASFAHRRQSASVVDLAAQRLALAVLRWSRRRVDRTAYTHEQMARLLETERATTRPEIMSPLEPR